MPETTKGAKPECPPPSASFRISPHAPRLCPGESLPWFAFTIKAVPGGLQLLSRNSQSSPAKRKSKEKVKSDIVLENRAPLRNQDRTSFLSSRSHWSHNVQRLAYQPLTVGLHEAFQQTTVTARRSCSISHGQLLPEPSRNQL